MPSAAELAAVPDEVEAATDDGKKPAMDPIEGATGQLSLAVGGRKPDSSEFKLKGKSVPVEGQYQKGDLVRLEVIVRVGELSFVDKVDNAGEVTHTTRRHHGLVQSARRIPDPSAVADE